MRSRIGSAWAPVAIFQSLDMMKRQPIALLKIGKVIDRRKESIDGTN